MAVQLGKTGAATRKYNSRERKSFSTPTIIDEPIPISSKPNLHKGKRDGSFGKNIQSDLMIPKYVSKIAKDKNLLSTSHRQESSLQLRTPPFAGTTQALKPHVKSPQVLLTASPQAQFFLLQHLRQLHALLLFGRHVYARFSTTLSFQTIYLCPFRTLRSRRS